MRILSIDRTTTYWFGIIISPLWLRSRRRLRSSPKVAHPATGHDRRGRASHCPERWRRLSGRHHCCIRRLRISAGRSMRIAGRFGLTSELSYNAVLSTRCHPCPCGFSSCYLASCLQHPFPFQDVVAHRQRLAVCSAIGGAAVHESYRDSGPRIFGCNPVCHIWKSFPKRILWSPHDLRSIALIFRSAHQCLQGSGCRRVLGWQEDGGARLSASRQEPGVSIHRCHHDR